MSVDRLQEKIRKCKNPSMVEFSMDRSLIPGCILEEEGDFVSAWRRFSRELLEGLKDVVPAVRFGMGSFALQGPEGMQALRDTLTVAGKLGYYVVLDAPEILSPMAAQNVADAWQAGLSCDAMVISSYLGSDALRPFVPLCQQGKAVFAVVRTANKTAPELQDLLTGSRHVHTAAAGMVNRHGESILGKFGYSQIGAVMGATNTDSIRSVRSKYNRLFFLVDGYDYSGANAKNCSYAFDRYGYGAVACAGSSITAAWKEAEDGADFVARAAEAANRMKKNLTRYVTII